MKRSNFLYEKGVSLNNLKRYEETIQMFDYSIKLNP